MVVGYQVDWMGAERVITSTEYAGAIVVTAHEWVRGATLCQCIDETIAALQDSDPSYGCVVACFDEQGNGEENGPVVVEVRR